MGAAASAPARDGGAPRGAARGDAAKLVQAASLPVQRQKSLSLIFAAAAPGGLGNGLNGRCWPQAALLVTQAGAGALATLLRWIRCTPIMNRSARLGD
jgi:hypothetical protein